MQAHAIETLDGFAALEPDWNELVDRTSTDNVFLTFEWLFTWWENLGRDRELLLLATEGNGQRRGLAPLMIDGGTVRFIGAPNADYSDFIGADQEAVCRAAVDWLFAHRDRWRRMDLTQIPERSPSIRYLRESLAHHGAHFQEKNDELCLAYEYDGAENGREAFQTERNATTRKSFNFFERQGGLKCRRLTTAEAIAPHWPAFFHNHIMRWRETTTPSKFLENGHRRFFETAVERLCPQGRAALAVAEYGGTPFAHLLAWSYKGAMNLYTVSYAPFHRRKSPGIVLLHSLTESCIREGYQRIDFSRGAGSHKALFVNRRSHNHRFVVYPSRATYVAAWGYDRAKAAGPVRKLLTNRRFQEIKARAVGRLAKEGPMKSALALLAKVFLRIFECRRIFIYVHEGAPREVAQPGVAIDTRVLDGSEADVEKIVSFSGCALNSTKHKTVLERFRRGARCYAACHHGHIVGAVWCLFQPDTDPDSGLTVTPGEKQAVISDALVSPPYRGKGILPVLRYRVISDLVERGYEMIGAVEAVNRANRRSMQKANYRLMRTIRIVRIFGKRIL